MSNFHLDHADDRLDAAELRAAELQDAIDRIAQALGVFDLGPLRTAAMCPGLSNAEAAVVLEARHAIRRARDVLSESGDWAGDYDGA